MRYTTSAFFDDLLELTADDLVRIMRGETLSPRPISPLKIKLMGTQCESESPRMRRRCVLAYGALGVAILWRHFPRRPSE